MVFYLYLKNIMKSRKPLAVRIFIRICVVAMVVSLVWVYVMYMFPGQQISENLEEVDNNAEVSDIINWEEDLGNVEELNDEELDIEN